MVNRPRSHFPSLSLCWCKEQFLRGSSGGRGKEGEFVVCVSRVSVCSASCLGRFDEQSLGISAVMGCCSQLYYLGTLVVIIMAVISKGGSAIRFPLLPRSHKATPLRSSKSSLLLLNKPVDKKCQTTVGFWRLLGKSRPPVVTKVITDIDDTVVSSGGLKLFGIALGGIDNLYKRGQFYPGAMQFALELSFPFRKAVSDLPARVAVLTARAREFKFALELRPSGKLCSAYRRIGDANGLDNWGIGEVYYGSVAEWILHHRKGWRKFSNFERMLQNDDLNSKHRHHYILIGDTGEKDEEAGERMAEKYPDRLRAIFMHTVYNHNAPPSSVPKDRKSNGVPIFYFRTYVGAAIKAYEARLLDRQAVIRVTKHCVRDLQRLDEVLQAPKMKMLNKFPGGRRIYAKAAEQQSLRWAELLADAQPCSFLLPLFPSQSDHEKSIL
eukprot:scaffold3243_cov173-Ochromonas_danica.AAC.36